MDTDIDRDVVQNDSPTNPPATLTDTKPTNIEPNTITPAPLQNTKMKESLNTEPKMAVKKDATLREFLNKMDDYGPIIPDAVTNYYLTLAGLPPPPHTPPHLARLLALATQKFISDIAADAYQYSRIRSTNTTSNNPLTGLGGVTNLGLGGAGAGADSKGGAAGVGAGGKDQGKGPQLGGPRPGYGGGGVAGSGEKGGQGRTVLTMEDLGMAVGEYGVNVKRGEFYR